MLTSRILMPCALLLVPLNVATAASFVFPAGSPTVTASASPPAWLAGNFGDDGYVTVRADVKMPPITCANLGRKGLVGNIFSEKMQIVASVKTVGFRTNLDGQNLPVATFDGRSAPGTCTGFNTLPATIIPYARLEPFSAAAPGALSIIFDIKSTTDKEANLVSAAQIALGAVAVFTTGGAATTVAGLTSAFAKPAMSNLEQKINESAGAIVAGQARLDLDWAAVRKGIGSVVVPVYSAKTAWMQTPAQAIEKRLSLKPAAEDKLFDVVLTFSYAKTLFDPSISGADDYPKDGALATHSVLNYPRLPGVQNFMQLLNANAPSLLQTIAAAKTPAEKSAAAGIGIEMLKHAGLNLTDRTIVMKSFIDEARGSIWYSPAEVSYYFDSDPDMEERAIKVYGMGGIFEIYDTQIGIGAAYANWKKVVPPILADLRQALTTVEARTGALANFNGGADIELSFIPSSSGWIPAAPTPGAVPVHTDPSVPGLAPVNVAVTYPPGLTRLGATGVTKAGCFVYGDEANLEPANFGGQMIVISEAGEPWRLAAKLAPGGAGKIGKITLAKLSEDWKNYFKGSSYKGGECPAILSSL